MANITANCTPPQLIGTNLRCNLGEYFGVLYSDKPVQFTDIEAQALVNYTDKFSADTIEDKLYFFLSDVPVEPTNPEAVFETLRDGINDKVGENAPTFIFKKTKASIPFTNAFSKMFSTQRVGYCFLLYRNGIVGYNNTSNGTIDAIACRAVDMIESVTSTTGAKVGLSIQPTNWASDRLSLAVVLDEVYNTNADFTITRDFYTTVGASTNVVDGAASTTDFYVDMLTVENVGISGITLADVEDVLADDVSILGDVTTVAAVAGVSGRYMFTTGTTFAAGVYVVVMKSESSLSFSGYSFVAENSGTLA